MTLREAYAAHMARLAENADDFLDFEETAMEVLDRKDDEVRVEITSGKKDSRFEMVRVEGRWYSKDELRPTLGSLLWVFPGAPPPEPSRPRPPEPTEIRRPEPGPDAKAWTLVYRAEPGSRQVDPAEIVFRTHGVLETRLREFGFVDARVADGRGALPGARPALRSCRAGRRQSPARPSGNARDEDRGPGRRPDRGRGPLDVENEKRLRVGKGRAYRSPKGAAPDYPGFAWFPERPPRPDSEPRHVLVRTDRWSFGHADLVNLRVRRDPSGIDGFIVAFSIRETRRRDFGALTGPNSASEAGPEGERQLALILGGRVEMAPFLRSRLTDGGYISGGSEYTKREAEQLVAALRSGPLPVRLVLEREKAED
jgi:hypothetical protein